MITKEETFYKNAEALLPTTFHLELKKKKKSICLKLIDALEYFDIHIFFLIYLYVAQLPMKYVESW